MKSGLRKRWLQMKNIPLDALSSQPAGSPVMLASTAGFANQVRAALAVALNDLVPVIQTNEAYQARAMQEEGIDMRALFHGLTLEDASHLRAGSYRDWVIPPWDALNPEEAAVMFNALNFSGIINPSILPQLPDLRARVQTLFDSFGPAIDRKETAARSNPDTLAVHLRMFGRNYATQYSPPGKHAAPSRHIVKEAWSAPRIASAVAMITTLTNPGDPVALYTDRRDHPDVLSIVAQLRAANREPGFATTTQQGALAAMEECLLLSGHKRMVLTMLSTFGHLGALLSEDLETVVAV